MTLPIRSARTSRSAPGVTLAFRYVLSRLADVPSCAAKSRWLRPERASNDRNLFATSSLASCSRRRRARQDLPEEFTLPILRHGIDDFVLQQTSDRAVGIAAQFGRDAIPQAHAAALDRGEQALEPPLRDRVVGRRVDVAEAGHVHASPTIAAARPASAAHTLAQESQGGWTPL